ncbi:MAG TPA: glycoside hydrolase [Terriglobales bacterium]|nr:glycoside hydrolase [Terriglobales bacterium]
MKTRLLALAFAMTILFNSSAGANSDKLQESRRTESVVAVDPSRTLSTWEGWGSSLSWWARAIGGTENSDFYADLIYSLKSTKGYPGLGLNIVRYNLGGGGVGQPGENKGPKLEWQMDISGYWVDGRTSDPNSNGWNWSLDSNQRAMMLMARDRGANVFELFSDSPMWWMNSNRSTAGSVDGRDCLEVSKRSDFATYLATVARYAADHWGIKFSSVEPFNEPSADWWKYPVRQEGCHFERNTQQVIIPMLRKALDDVGLNEVVIAAADENDMEAALGTWNEYTASTRRTVGKVNVHGYYRGAEPYRGKGRVALRRAVGNKRVWVSEYGEPDASGLTMSESIVQDIRGLSPSAWVYWQPVEPDVEAYGWGMMNANYVDTSDKPNANATTPLVRINRKFFVYGQFTRFIRPGYQIIPIRDEHSIAAYDSKSNRLVVVTVNSGKERTVNFDLSAFRKIGRIVQQVATTTAPGNGVPDWLQHSSTLSVDPTGKMLRSVLHPNSIYTFVFEARR